MQPLNSSTARLAERINAIRCECFGTGSDGLRAVATRFALPERTWANYEAGVTMPATIMIQFIVVTRANPAWLMDETGDRFLASETGKRGVWGRSGDGY